MVSIFSFKLVQRIFFFFGSHLKCVADFFQVGNVLHYYKVFRVARNIYNKKAAEMLHICNETNRRPDCRNETY